jgi:hypothetical protein
MKNRFRFTVISSCLAAASALSQSPIRVGTTAAEFLDIGYGPAGLAMGDAYVSRTEDITSVYWNPAGLSFMKRPEVVFSYQPWIADIQTYLLAAGLSVPGAGTLAIGLVGVNYGSMKVTTVEAQSGTGETFYSGDYAFSLSYGRRLAEWFGFGATAKYIRSNIWHASADAFALDLGVLIQTPFFSPTSRDEHGMRLGMSLSNYGTRMSYQGMDLMRSVDISSDEAGNYKDSKAYLATDSWELPLIFRVGFSVSPLVLNRHQLVLAADALHVNNNNESVNIGAEYRLSAPGMGMVFFRGGYRALFLEESQFGPTFGFGTRLQMIRDTGIQVDYAYRDIGLLGYVNVFGVRILF